MWFPGPVLFKIGPFPINTLGVAVALATIIGIWLVVRGAKREGLDADYLVEFAVYTLIGGIIGARLWFVVFKWQDYVNNPIEIFMVWMGGLAIQGGILGGLLVGVWLAKRKKLPIWQVTDLFAPSLILGMAIGRIADFLDGDAYGIPSDSILAVSYPPGTYVYNIYGDTPVLPMPLFEAIGDIVIFVLLLLIRNRKQFQGLLFLLMLALYSASRFTMEFWRGDSLRTIFNLKVAQLTALVTIIIAVALIIYRARSSKNKKQQSA